MEHLLFEAFKPFYPMFLILIVFSIVVAFLKSPYFKGKMGEKMVALHAEQLGKDYVMLHDCTLPCDGGTTQIDHILISPFGVFVVETKNYEGWIFGGARQKQWTQQLYKKRFRFQNPLHQNYKHIKVLEVLLADLLEAEHLHSLVVFTPRSTFKTPMPEHVCRGREWLDYIKRFQTPVLSEMQCKMLRHRIENEALAPGFKTNAAHVAGLRGRNS